MGKLFTEDKDLLLLQPVSSTPVNLKSTHVLFFFTLVFSRCRYKEMSVKQQLADWQLDKQHHAMTSLTYPCKTLALSSC